MVVSPSRIRGPIRVRCRCSPHSLSSVVEHGRRMAERSSAGRLDPPLTFVLDDVAALAPLPTLPGLLAAAAPAACPRWPCCAPRNRPGPAGHSTPSRPDPYRPRHPDHRRRHPQQARRPLTRTAAGSPALRPPHRPLPVNRPRVPQIKDPRPAPSPQTPASDTTPRPARSLRAPTAVRAPPPARPDPTTTRWPPRTTPGPARPPGARAGQTLPRTTCVCGTASPSSKSTTTMPPQLPSSLSPHERQRRVAFLAAPRPLLPQLILQARRHLKGLVERHPSHRIGQRRQPQLLEPLPLVRLHRSDQVPHRLSIAAPGAADQRHRHPGMRENAKKGGNAKKPRREP